jgi:hypothetical protein
MNRCISLIFDIGKTRRHLRATLESLYFVHFRVLENHSGGFEMKFQVFLNVGTRSQCEFDFLN